MSIDKRSIKCILQTLSSHGVVLEKDLINDVRFMNYMKYELLRSDVSSNYEDYFQKQFPLRKKLFLNNDYLIIPKIVFALSNECSLQCKNCSMLMPLYKENWHVTIDEAKNNIDSLLSAVDEVLNFNVIGGEPFIYKDLDKVLDYLLKLDKVKQVSVFTNGMNKPNESVLALLKNPKISVVLSDYGNLVKMSEFVVLLEENHINLSVRSDNYWIDFGGVQSRKRDESELRQSFDNCMFSGNCKALLGDKFFVCERAARLYALKCGYESTRDYISISSSKSKEELANGIKQLFAADVADACNYCDSGVLPQKMINAGEQFKQRYNISKFTIVPRTDYEDKSTNLQV